MQDNSALLQELCYIYVQRNRLQTDRNSKRFKLNRARNKFKNNPCAATKFNLLLKEADLLDTRIAIAHHVATTHARIVKLGHALCARQFRCGDNRIACIRIYTEFGLSKIITAEEFSEYAEKHVVKLAIEGMLEDK